MDKKNSQKVWVLLTWIVITAMLLSGCGNAQEKRYTG